MLLRHSFLLTAAFCALTFGASAATINVAVSPLATPGQYRYSYAISGVNLTANQDIDLQFAAATYSALTNGQAGAGFRVYLFQPNNPPGVAGDFVALSTVNNPSLAGPFSVDFTYLGMGTPSGIQPYAIDTFDANGNLIAVNATGFTALAGSTSNTPEPSSVALAGIGLAVGGWLRSRKRLRGTI